MKQSQQFDSFANFYPFYLGEHQDRTSRRLHVIGTSCVIALFATSVILQQFKLLWLLPLVGYSFAWLGHFIFEKNRPATFKHPIYSLMGDFKMWWQVLSGQIRW